MRAKRSLLIVDRDRTKQFHYGLMNVSVVLVVILLLAAAMMYQTFTTTSDVGAACGIDSIPSALNRVDAVWIATTFAVILTGGLCFAYVLFVTRRFLGPLVAISRHIDALLEGNFDVQTNLREKDEMQELALKLNQLSETLKANYEKK